MYPEDFEMKDRYSVEPDDDTLNGFVDLSSNYSEDEIRFALTQLFRTKFSLIQPNNFEFIKREIRVLCTPLVPDGFKWNFESIKALCSQRKLRCRLKVDTRTLISEDPKNVQEEEQTSSIDIPTDAAQLPSTSNNRSSSELQHLMEMFPTKTLNQIQLVLTEHGNMNDAVFALTT